MAPMTISTGIQIGARASASPMATASNAAISERPTAPRTAAITRPMMAPRKTNGMNLRATTVSTTIRKILRKVFMP